MNISNILNFSVSKITGTKEKIPVILFAVAILSSAFNILSNLIYAILGSTFLFGIGNFLNVLSIIALVLLGIYLILLFVKQKNALHLVAGIFLIFSNILSTILTSNLCWLVFAVCIAYLPFTSDDEDNKAVSKLGALAVVVVIVLSLLTSGLWRLPRFIYGLYFVILSAVSAVQLVLLLVLVLINAEQAGGVDSVIEDIVAKVKGGRSASDNTQVLPEIELSETRDSVPYPVTTETSASVPDNTYANVIPTKPTVAPGRYQYKTVAGPIGLTISKNDSYGDGVKQYAALIDSESVGGWELDSIHEIPVTKNNGCIAALMGRPTTTVIFNMLIFRKED